MQNDERDLRDRTKRFALSVIRMFSMIPKTTEAQVLGKQLLRSSTSVGANYREAYPPKLLAALRQECDELIAIFVTILKRSKEPFETS